MAKDNTVYQQQQWIYEDYKSIIEDPESYGYTNIIEHIDEVIADIKEDIEQAFGCEINKDIIINLILQQTYEQNNCIGHVAEG